jgi:ribosomal protein L2
MNREQRRAMQKKTGLSFDEIKAVENLAEIKAGQGTPLDFPTIPEGTKVRINTDRIFKQKDFARLQPSYRKIVQESRDKVYTVEYDPERRDRPSLVCLKEDPSEIKWLWHVSDLEVVA